MAIGTPTVSAGAVHTCLHLLAAIEGANGLHGVGTGVHLDKCTAFSEMDTDLGATEKNYQNN